MDKRIVPESALTIHYLSLRKDGKDPDVEILN
jgi:hypothetical protein